MATPLPSLTALRAFEAVGRLGSFTKAAAELKVTQAAVSHQVRVLEAQLGQPLLRRSTRKLSLTPVGARLLPATSSAFAELLAAVAEVRRGDRQLAITTTPGFGARWLAPRLGRFASAHPDWEITVRHTTSALDLEREGLHAGIRWGSGKWPSLRVELIALAPLMPMASPDLVKARGLETPEDLTRVTLLHDEDNSEWQEWLLVAGLNPDLARRGLVFDDENALFQAALEGQGVALLTPGLVGDALISGRLVRPLQTSLAADSGYYLVYPPSRANDPKLQAFREFLLAEGQAARPT
ncbi:MAG: transcriptional regulator GcvA [Rhodospirillales bacterium]